LPQDASYHKKVGFTKYFPVQRYPLYSFYAPTFYRIFRLTNTYQKTLDYPSLVKRCIEDHSKAKKELYEGFAPAMFAICCRYAKNHEDAEDIFQQAFIKIFEKLHQLRDPQTLPGWLKSIFIHEALDFYKTKYQKQHFTEINDHDVRQFDINEAVGQLNMEEIRAEINKLPDKCRLVFNLYVIDGFSHQEIGEMTQISVGTSKSQLFEAKRRLKIQISKKYDYIATSK
jgi:RNA polymerase sigma-70 factor (ECF subfamily)